MKEIRNRIIVDVLMLVLLLSLMDLSLTGFSIHERVGIAVGIIFIFHTILHSRWIKAASCGIRNSGQWKLKLMAGLNVLLGISYLMTVITGMLIARTMPYMLYFNESGILITVHHSAAYMALLLSGIHIGIHWKALRQWSLRKIPENRKPAVVLISRVLAVLVITVGVRSLITLNYGQVLASPFTGISPLIIQETPADPPDSEQVAIENAVADEALQKYLDGLICTGCSRHCPLLAPQCQIGLRQAREAEQAFLDASENNSAAINAEPLIQSISAFEFQRYWLFPEAVGLFILGSYYVISWKKGKLEKDESHR